MAEEREGKNALKNFLAVSIERKGFFVMIKQPAAKTHTQTVFTDN